MKLSEPDLKFGPTYITSRLFGFLLNILQYEVL